MFLYDLANEMVAESQKSREPKYTDKLKHEFYTVCMLNALFGNPNIPLVQLHPSYHGPKTIQRLFKCYGDKNLNFEQIAALDKKRRNAATEVLRFFNQAEFKLPECPIYNASDDQIYAKAYQMLLCGDFRHVIKHLTWHKKTKLAMIVSQSVNSVASQSLLRMSVQNFYSNGNFN